MKKRNWFTLNFMIVKLWHMNFKLKCIHLKGVWTFKHETNFKIDFSFNPSNLCQFSSSVMSDYLWPHGLQHARLPHPSPAPRACSNSCPSSWWCHPTISSCRPLLLLPSIFPTIKVFLISQFFASGGQRTGASASASVLPMNIQDWFPLGLTGNQVLNIS